MAPWARALVAQGAAPLKVAAASPARPPPPSLQLGGGSEPGWILNSPRLFSAGGRGQKLPTFGSAGFLTVRLKLRTLLEFRNVSPDGFGLLVVTSFFFPRVGKQQSNLKFAEELRILSVLIISLRFCSAFTEHSCSFLL